MQFTYLEALSWRFALVRANNWKSEMGITATKGLPYRVMAIRSPRSTRSSSLPKLRRASAIDMVDLMD